MLEIEDYEGEDYRIVRFSVEFETEKRRKFCSKKCFGCLKVKKE